ncbi:MAG: 16S rRNA (uracil(1498)-N(3))-methyltransferase [Actinomycetaceae bacterium]|nr:16S rRNA (uracil(1498)-N(3))-methyltransferase [Actinomycetaceae bacterium]
MTTPPVFLIDPGAAAPSGRAAVGEGAGFAVGETVSLYGEEARHAHVKRIAAGETIDLVDGQGLRLTCEVVGVAKTAVEAVVRRRVVEEPPRPRLTLVQALAKGGRDEQAIEAATEVGIDRVIPWEARRSIVQWSGPKADKGRAKWQSICVSAMKQSRRAFLPGVEEVLSFRGIEAWTRSVIGEGGAVLVCHESAERHLSDLLNHWGNSGKSFTEIAVVVGPEGGIDEDELAAFRAGGAEIILLGPHVLRSSTAGPLATALVAAGCGRW